MVSEVSPLLVPNLSLAPDHQINGHGSPHQSSGAHEEAQLPKDERALHGTGVGERLPYANYTTIDWLHDLAKDFVRYRHIHSLRGIKARFWQAWDNAQGWVAAAIIGLLTAVVAFVVDVGVVIVSDWKNGYCSRNVFLNRESCCVGSSAAEGDLGACTAWTRWSEDYRSAYFIYVGWALLFGVIAGSVTMTTRMELPSASPDGSGEVSPPKKFMYMAAGSGIPEIKTILSGFVIPHFLDLKVLVVKAVGATFAVPTGMCLGKEGPFVHISTCVGYLVARWFPKFRSNERNLREMLSVACSAGLSVAFGAPIGGILFSYEEISTYFPREVLWKSFLCSGVAAAALRQLNPTGTGKLVLFETNYGTNYDAIHYLAFILLGVAGGLFGGVFCQANFTWSRQFRKYTIIKNYPVFELSLVVFVTAFLQYPNPMIRETGDVALAELLADCSDPQHLAWICRQETLAEKGTYYFWLIEGTLVKLILTIITFGCKVPSGVIIPALDAGALFGRLLGQIMPNSSPGIFAMVGAAAFLAGVSRMTVSLAVIMFELTGEVYYILPIMTAILTAKWVADAISAESVYELAQHILGHPFLDPEHALRLVRARGGTVEDLIPPKQTMEQITLHTGSAFLVQAALLRDKLQQLKARGLMDAGLVLVNNAGVGHGYLPQAELEFMLGLIDEGATEIDLRVSPFADFVDQTPLTVPAKAPVEFAVEMFGKLGLRYLVVVEVETSQVVGVIIKKRLVSYVDSLR